MTEEKTMYLASLIGTAIATGIAENADDAEIENEKKNYGKEDFAEMEEVGIYDGDFEKYFVIRSFLQKIRLGDYADGRYICELFKRAKHFDADEFEKDAYIKNVNFKDARKGNILLTHAHYGRGEIFQYDMPDFSNGYVVPYLGFFSRRVDFPALYEGDMPWVSVCPSEINSMKRMIDEAQGNILVLGLGLAYYTYMAAASDKVKSVTVVEINGDIIDIFSENLLPEFVNKEKIKIIKEDAVEYLKGVKNGEYDFCFADIWEGAVDGAPLYLKIKKEAKRLSDTRFTYWIEDQIKAYLSED